MIPNSLPRRDFLNGVISSCFLAPFLSGKSDDSQKIWTVGVIGDTDLGGYGHGLDRVWLDIPQARIIALADPSAKGREKAVERLHLGADAAFADYREMLKSSTPDLVAVCPRNISHHRDMILAAIEAGAKGIYVEKPYCRDLIEADEITAAAEKQGTKIAIAHRNRYHPVLPVVAQLIEDGAIGQWLEIRARGKEDHRGGGLDLWVLGSHLFNLAHYFTGKPLSCSATVLQQGKLASSADIHDGAEGVGPLIGDEIHARYETERGIPVFFDSLARAGAKGGGFGLQFIGNAGVIDLRIDEDPFAHYRAGNPLRPGTEAQPWEIISTAGIGKPEPLPDLHQHLMDHQIPTLDLIAAISENRAPLCSAADGEIVTEMILSVFESHRQGGARVPLPLTNRQNPLTKF